MEDVQALCQPSQSSHARALSSEDLPGVGSDQRSPRRGAIVPRTFGPDPGARLYRGAKPNRRATPRIRSQSGESVSAVMLDGIVGRILHEAGLAAQETATPLDYRV
jgi:hypothetical protein